MMDTNEKLYGEGFNNGYLLAKYEPDLTKQLIASPNNYSDYFKGIVSGKQEYDMEKVRERLKGMNQNDTPSKDITQNKGKEK